jgi:hypothetical protein
VSDAEIPTGYPTMDATLDLPSGARARVRNLVVFRGSSSTLTIVVQAPALPADRAQAAAEAKELADLHDEFARVKDVDRIGVSICTTAACVELKERPAVIFCFRRGTDGSWEAESVVGS